MTNLKIRFATAIATGAVLVSSVAPAFAATTIEISGNGRDSTNDAAVATHNSTTVTQTNVANINNNTTVNSDTGHNKANDNIGGDVTVKSGAANTDVTVQNSANSNVANVANCGGCNGGADVLISGNGRNSTNEVGLTQVNRTGVEQTNVANVNNNTTVNSNTGHNKANDNGGQGDVSVESGAVDTTVTVGTAVNSNVAAVGGSSAGANNGVSARILGNGRNSDNSIALLLANSAEVAQTNVANVNNNTTVNSDTGFNKANDNIGGDVSVKSGKANTDVNVDTMANFNAASLDACCNMAVTAKIANNLRDSENTIGATLCNDSATFQTSVLNGNNNTNVNKETGHNKANDNGAAYDNADPRVTSGDASTNVDVSTSGNTNHVGTGLTLPMPGNNQVTFSWNWAGMSAWMAWMMNM